MVNLCGWSKTSLLCPLGSQNCIYRSDFQNFTVSINDRYRLNLHIDICISQYDHDCRHFRNAVAAKALAYVAPWKTNWDTIRIYKGPQSTGLQSKPNTKSKTLATFKPAWSKTKGNDWKEKKEVSQYPVSKNIHKYLEHSRKEDCFPQEKDPTCNVNQCLQ